MIRYGRGLGQTRGRIFADDTQSLIRLLLYANVLDIEGLVATTSVHQKSRVGPESIERVIRAYGEVEPNLSRHAEGFSAEGFPPKGSCWRS